MTSNLDHRSLSKVELLVLARLAGSKGATEKALIAAVEYYASQGATTPPHEQVSDALGVLQRQSLATQPKSVRGKVPHPKLTNEGRRVLCSALGATAVPNWDRAKQYLATVGINRSISTKRRDSAAVARPRRPAPSRDRKLAVLKRHFDIPSVSTVGQLCDALISKALGFSGKVTVARLRAHVLTRGLNLAPAFTAKENLEAVAERVARHVQATAAPSTQVPFRPALVSVPINRNPPASIPAPATPADLLLDVVREAIPQIGADGRFGPEKVFVSALFHYIEDDVRMPELSLDRFKRWLVTANRDQLIDLVRADSQGDMDSRLLEESEIQDFGATFHFVIDRHAVTTGRGYHAR